LKIAELVDHGNQLDLRAADHSACCAERRGINRCSRAAFDEPSRLAFRLKESADVGELWGV